MQNSTDTIPPRRRRFFTWKMFRRGLLGLVILITCCVILGTAETWFGKRAMENYTRELAAKGEKLSFKDFIPAPVQDDQNFAMTPFLAPLFDFNPLPLQPGQSRWRDTNAVNRTHIFSDNRKSPKNSGTWTKQQMTDLSAWAWVLQGNKEVEGVTNAPLPRGEAATEVLRLINEKYAPVFEELQIASRRPYARFNIQYDGELVWGILLSHLSVLKGVGMTYATRASAELALDQSGKALADTKMIFYLSRTINNEPFIISGLVEVAIVSIAIQPVWEGLNEHRWSDAQLAELERVLGEMNLVADCETVLRGERALNLQGLEQIRMNKILFMQTLDGPAPEGSAALSPLIPDGWIYQNELNVARVYQDFLLPGQVSTARRFYPSVIATNDERLTKFLSREPFPYHTLFARMLVPAISKAKMKFAVAQGRLDQARVACALERYRLAHGEFPEKLAALSPQLIEKLPADLITGEPLKYKLTTDGQFILYSVGWNEKDDDGAVVFNKGSTSTGIDYSQGDWVWKYADK